MKMRQIGKSGNVLCGTIALTSIAASAFAADAPPLRDWLNHPLATRSVPEHALGLVPTDDATFDTSPRAYLDFVNQFGNDYVYGAFTAGWQRDTRDSVITPNAGGFTRLSGEVAGGDLEYYRLNFQQSYYWRLSRIYTLLARGELGYAHGLGQKPVPFFKGYYAGGPDSVRGFRPFSLGPRDVDGNSTGGTFKVIGATELLFPMPGATAEQSLRLGAFIDFGQVYAADTQVRLGELRYAGGFALQWLSPFGPLRLSIANPINRKDGDQVQRLQFTFGTGF